MVNKRWHQDVETCDDKRCLDSLLTIDMKSIRLRSLLDDLGLSLPTISLSRHLQLLPFVVSPT